MTRPTPEYYVLLCAKRYAAAVNELAISTTDEIRREAAARLCYIYQSGLIEFHSEIKRRESEYPDDFRRALVEKDGSTITRSISREESECVRCASAVPAFTSIDNLSAVEMHGLADMFEGWAQSDLVNPVIVARLHGWADGFRSLVEAVGSDYLPVAASPDAPISLMKTLAVKMTE